MGLLDDAIREHLELKRRRGADSGEITRQEQEAFGPARRGDVEPAGDAPAVAVAEAPTTLHAVEDHHEHDAELADPPRPHGDPADDLPHAEEAHPHVEEHTHLHDSELTDEPVGQGDPADHLPHIEPDPVQEHHVVEPPPAAEPAAPPPSASQPTREFDLDEVRAATGEEATPRAEEADEDAEEGDVLEETPEFLQETPEHDRLWFEQRPPRDFDF